MLIRCFLVSLKSIESQFYGHTCMIHVLQSAEKLSKNGQRLKYIYRWKGLGLWYTKKIILIQKFKLYWYFWAKNLKIWGRLAQFFIFFCQKISLPSKSEDAFWNETKNSRKNKECRHLRFKMFGARYLSNFGTQTKF